MKKCGFRYPGFICSLPLNHPRDHEDAQGVMMFNVDKYTVKKVRKVKA